MKFRLQVYFYLVNLSLKERCLSQFPAIFMGDNIASDWPNSPRQDGWNYCVDCLANLRQFCPPWKLREPDYSISLCRALTMVRFVGKGHLNDQTKFIAQILVCHLPLMSDISMKVRYFRISFLITYKYLASWPRLVTALPAGNAVTSLA